MKVGLFAIGCLELDKDYFIHRVEVFWYENTGSQFGCTATLLCRYGSAGRNSTDGGYDKQTENNHRC
jgi:hypothetical protein